MEVPRSDFAPDVELNPGLVFETENDEGHTVYFIVQEVKDDKVIIDFNHPLAGKEMEITLYGAPGAGGHPGGSGGPPGLQLFRMRGRRRPLPLTAFRFSSQLGP